MNIRYITLALAVLLAQYYHLPLAVAQNVYNKSSKQTFIVEKQYEWQGKIYQTRVISSYSAVGTASWYGKEFRGRKTANGEKYNNHHYTAAHRSLPFNTVVRVTNLKNNRSVYLRINDRGPYSKGSQPRLIDVSKVAAKELGFLSDGLTLVKIESLGQNTKR